MHTIDLARECTDTYHSARAYMCAPDVHPLLVFLPTLFITCTGTTGGVKAL